MPQQTLFPAPSRVPLIAAAALGLALGGCSESVAPEVVDPEWVVLLSKRGLDPHLVRVHIYRATVDGSTAEMLSPEAAQYGHMTLSPDGTRLAFAAAFSGCQNIWSMNVDGTDLRQLSGVGIESRCNNRPRWSPDGSRIAFQSTDDRELGWEVHVMNADGTGRVNVTNNPSTELATNADLVHTWRSDGKLVIVSNRDGTPRYYEMNADGTDIAPLFEETGYSNPVWSPDLSRLLVRSASDDGIRLHLMIDDEVVDIADEGEEVAFVPALADPWSPDGSRFAFIGGSGTTRNIRVVNADGTGLTHVTSTPDQNVFRGWSPDGSRIVFTSDRGGSWDVYVINVDGTGLVNVTDTDADDSAPIWVPVR